MDYDIYPCDLTCDGECPKACQDCENCIGWTEDEADAQIALEEELDKLLEEC